MSHSRAAPRRPAPAARPAKGSAKRDTEFKPPALPGSRRRALRALPDRGGPRRPVLRTPLARSGTFRASKRFQSAFRHDSGLSGSRLRAFRPRAGGSGAKPGFPSPDACSEARKARKRAVLLASDVARPGKPGIVPSCAAERRQTPARPPRWRQPFENQLPSPGGPFRLEASLPPNPLQTGKPLSERSRLVPCDAQQAFGLGERWQAC